MCRTPKRQAQPETRGARVERSTARGCWPFIAFLWARPWAQLQLSVRIQGTVFLLGPCPGLWGHRAPHTSLQSCSHPYCPFRSATQKAGRGGGQGASMNLCTQPSHRHTGGPPGATLPASLKPGFAMISIWCSAVWAWMNDKRPQMEQTSTGVFPGF